MAIRSRLINTERSHEAAGNEQGKGVFYGYTTSGCRLMRDIKISFGYRRSAPQLLMIESASQRFKTCCCDGCAAEAKRIWTEKTNVYRRTPSFPTLWGHHCHHLKSEKEEDEEMLMGDGNSQPYVFEESVSALQLNDSLKLIISATLVIDGEMRAY